LYTSPTASYASTDGRAPWNSDRPRSPGGDRPPEAGPIWWRDVPSRTRSETALLRPALAGGETRRHVRGRPLAGSGDQRDQQVAEVAPQARRSRFPEEVVELVGVRVAVEQQAERVVAPDHERVAARAHRAVGVVAEAVAGVLPPDEYALGREVAARRRSPGGADGRGRGVPGGG